MWRKSGRTIFEEHYSTIVRHLVLHVGLPKTGTTSLQHLLALDERFAGLTLIPSRASQLADSGGAQRREELRHVLPVWTVSGSRPMASRESIEERAKTLAELLGSTAEWVFLSEEMFTLSPHSPVRENAAVLGRAVEYVRRSDPMRHVQLVMGTRNPRPMLDSFCSYFLAFREQNRDTPALESRIVTEWDQDTMLSLRQGTVLELFVNSVRPDQVVTLPLDLLQRDEIAYHKRLEAVTGVDLSDLPLAGFVKNARGEATRGQRVVRDLTGPWRYVRAAQEKLEWQLGPGIRSTAPQSLRIWVSKRMNRATREFAVAAFSPAFLDWYDKEMKEEAAKLALYDPHTPWVGLGYGG